MLTYTDKTDPSYRVQVARHLVQDTICCPVSSELEKLPVKSPLFTTNLLAGIGELYSRVTGTTATDYSAPPPATVRQTGPPRCRGLFRGVA